MAGKAQSVDDWMAGFDHPAKAGVERLRRLLLAAHEGLGEHIKWNGPSFRHQGDDRITIGLDPKGAIRVILHRGVKVKEAEGFAFDDPSGLIRWAAPDRGVITLKDAQAVEAHAGALSDIAHRWIEATAEGAG